MSSKVYCPVCQVSFPARQELELGQLVVCPVCGAELEITDLDGETAPARRYPQEPEAEMRQRAENFARQRGYVFQETKEDVMEGLLDKYHRFGDFYCPCRFDNIPEHVCPCLPTRSNEVRKMGHCL